MTQVPGARSLGGTADPGEATIRSGTLSGGISQAPPHARLPGQVAFAVNTVFDIADGAQKRPASRFVHHLGSSIGSLANTRLHPVPLGASTFLLIYGHSLVRVIEDGATIRDCGVTVDADAQTYLNLNAAGTTDRLRAATAADVVYLINTTVPTSAVEQSGSITGASVANPTVITATGHGLASGQRITIENSSGITPSINGSHVVTVTGVNTFTIPVNVTASVSPSASWSRGSIDKTTMPARMLFRRFAVSGTITSNTAANPTVVTTPVPHLFQTGDLVVIAGSNSTPSINGTHAATVLSPTTFTVPVNVTVAGTAGSYASPAQFRVSLVDWEERQSGNATTNPAPELLTRGEQLADVTVMRDRLMIGGGSRGLLSATGNHARLYVGDATTLTDADRINFAPPGDGGATINWLTPIRKSVLISTNEGRQFEAGTGDVLKPGTLSITPTTRLDAKPRPTIMDPFVYFVTTGQAAASLHEYFFDDIDLPSTSEDVTQHAKDLIFIKSAGEPSATIRRVVSSAATGSVFILRTGFAFPSYQGSDIFEFKSQWSGRERVQKAWTRHSIGDALLVDDIAVIGAWLYALRRYDLIGGVVRILEKYPIQADSAHRVK